MTITLRSQYENMIISVSGLLLIFFFIFVFLEKSTLSFKKSILVGFLLRIFFLLLSVGIINYDIQSYQIIGATTRNLVSIYPELALFRYPYIPFFLYLQTLATFIKPYDILFIKFVIIIFDTAIIYLAYLITSKKRVSFLYAINPITIFVSSIHGQFDSIPLFFLLTAVYALRKNKIILTGVLYSFAVAVKTWPIFFIFIFLKSLSWKKRFLFLILTISAPLLAIGLYSGVFKTPFTTIITIVRTYQPVYGVYGLGLLLKSIFGREDLYFVGMIEKIFLFSLLTYSFVLRKKTPVESIFAVLLFLFVFTPVFGIQWFLWISPFVLIVNPKGTIAIIGTASLFLLLTYAGWGRFEDSVMIGLAGAATWVSFFYVFIRYTVPNSFSSKVPSSSKSAK